jgi:hypothetical protein
MKTRMLSDLWIKHFEVKDATLVVTHDSGQLTLAVKEISSHKHPSHAHFIIRLFSGQRHDLDLTCFRVDEISDFNETLKEIERENHAKN